MNKDRSLNAIKQVKERLSGIVPEKAFTDKEFMAKTVYKLITDENEHQSTICATLQYLLEANYLNPKQIYVAIESGLLHSADIDIKAKELLIESLLNLTLHELNTSLSLGERITRDDAGKLALQCLEKETNINAENLQIIKTLDLIKIFGYKPAASIVKAIQDTSSSKQVKEIAQSTLYSLNNCLESTWTNTPVDHTSNLEQRYSELKDYLYDSELNESEYIQALFNATKDRAVENSNDPRYEILSKLLDKNANYQRLRLATAFAILKTKDSEKDLVKASIESLTDIGVNSTDLDLNIEAANLLEFTQESYPGYKAMIKVSRDKANLEFIKKFNS